jgi:hypothetical protein
MITQKDIFECTEFLAFKERLLQKMSDYHNHVNLFPKEVLVNSNNITMAINGLADQIQQLNVWIDSLELSMSDSRLSNEQWYQKQLLCHQY